MASRSMFRAKSLCLAVALVSLVFSACNENEGIKTNFGVSNKTISLGILTPLTRPVADPIGLPLTQGIEVFFDSVNAHGGIDGYRVTLVERDTEYDPAAAGESLRLSPFEMFWNVRFWSSSLD
jgi:ABC-type branched-subunit amino acid transport system substrate-binding protein